VRIVRFPTGLGTSSTRARVDYRIQARVPDRHQSAAAVISAICLSLSACCDERARAEVRSSDGAAASIVERGCGATTRFVTKVFVDGREVFRANADPREVSVKWQGDGRMLFVSLPEGLSSRDIFVKRDAAGARTIKYVRRPSETGLKAADAPSPSAPDARSGGGDG
jgi:hypothetical protein